MSTRSMRPLLFVVPFVICGIVFWTFTLLRSLAQAPPTIAPTVALVPLSPAPAPMLPPIDVWAIDRLVSAVTSPADRKDKEWAHHEQDDARNQSEVVILLEKSTADPDEAKTYLDRFRNRHRRLFWNQVVMSLGARDMPNTLTLIWESACRDSEGQAPQADPAVLSKARDVLRDNFGLVSVETCAHYLK